MCNVFVLLFVRLLFALVSVDVTLIDFLRVMSPCRCAVALKAGIPETVLLLLTPMATY